MYSKILIPVDMAHLEKAASMINSAKRQADEGAKFILLNVVDEVPTWAVAMMPDKEVFSHHRQEAQDELAKIVQDYDLDAEIKIRLGHSYTTILQEAEESDVDLIIIGSHHPGVGDYFLGSTAAKVVRHAKCSVFVIR
jgi:nucleotide-binding universal stress UspA family protein